MATAARRNEDDKEVKAVKAATEERVLAPFAFARAKGNGEVIMLAKGDLITNRFVEGKEGEANTLAHLRAIGFIGSQD